MNRETLTPKTDTQAKRFEDVLKFLDKRGITQAEIAKTANIDPAVLSRFKSGKTKSISVDLVNTLQNNYFINPRYISCDSDIMVDIMGKKLSALENFVDSWDTVVKQKMIRGERITKNYLHFTMDKNLYDFLIEVDKAQLISEEGISSLYNEINSLKELYESDPKPQEYVVIPKNDYAKIVKDYIDARQVVDEIMNFAEEEIFLEESEITLKK